MGSAISARCSARIKPTSQRLLYLERRTRAGVHVHCDAAGESGGDVRCALDAGGSRRAAAGEGCRILVVDDNRDAAQLLADSPQVLGRTIHIAHDGPSALAAAEAFRPQVALLDLGLPVMDGFEVGERLRADYAHDGIVLIAITGYAQEVDRQRTAAAGFERHLVKPVDVLQVDTMVRQRTGGPGAAL